MRTSSGRFRARGRALAIAAIGISAIVVPTAADAGTLPDRDAKARVMTRNLYLGADLTPAILAPNAAAAYTAVGNIYKQMQDANFNARAKLIANEIETHKPHLIGLQEVAHWMRDDEVDPNVQSTETVYDYLELLTDELKRRGLVYNVVHVQNEADLEFPADTRGGTNGGPDGTPDFDARLLMRDVILARPSVQLVGEPGGANYPQNVTINAAVCGGCPVEVKRGYNYADVKMRPRATPFRFVNTHLEAFNATFRELQAKNLTIGSGVTDVPRPVVVVGDLNSDPVDQSCDPPQLGGGCNNNAYEAFVDDGFVDLGVEVNTCCFSETIRDENPAFTSRIDHVLGKPFGSQTVTEVASTLVGTDQSNRSGTELWPSDHGGVVTRLVVTAPTP